MKIKINNDNLIIGFFKLNSKKPYSATGCNMQQNESGIEIDDKLLDLIKVNKSKFINNQIINEE